jgi:hypothetical protein
MKILNDFMVTVTVLLAVLNKLCINGKTGFAIIKSVLTITKNKAGDSSFLITRDVNEYSNIHSMG